MGYLSQFFLQMSQITCLQIENFVVAIVYLVYFALKYMYFEDPWVKSGEFPKIGVKWGFTTIFKNWGNMVGTLCAEEGRLQS